MAKPTYRVTDRRPVTGDWAHRIPFAIEIVNGSRAVMPIADICDQPNARETAYMFAAAHEMQQALFEISQIHINEIGDFRAVAERMQNTAINALLASEPLGAKDKADFDALKGE